MKLALIVIFAGFGCQKYIPLANSGADRVWLITEDGTEIFRCWDLKNQTGKMIAVCRRAENVGKGETTAWTELADRTAPPPHPDSTESQISPTSDSVPSADVHQPQAMASSPAPPLQCTGGRVINHYTGGHCCWPDQAFIRNACTGVPTCPSGFTVHGSECVTNHATNQADDFERPPMK